MSFVKDYVLVPIAGVAAWGWAFTHKKIDDNHKTAKDHTDKEVEKVTQEVTRQRDISAKLFDKLDDMSERATTRHLELLQTIHSGLAGKADK